MARKIKFKTLEEFREYNRKKSLKYYAKKKKDPEFIEKRRAYQRKRYAEMVKHLKTHSN